VIFRVSWLNRQQLTIINYLIEGKSRIKRTVRRSPVEITWSPMPPAGHESKVRGHLGHRKNHNHNGKAISIAGCQL